MASVCTIVKTFPEHPPTQITCFLLIIAESCYVIMNQLQHLGQIFDYILHPLEVGKHVRRTGQSTALRTTNVSAQSCRKQSSFASLQWSVSGIACVTLRDFRLPHRLLVQENQSPVSLSLSNAPLQTFQSSPQLRVRENQPLARPSLSNPSLRTSRPSP